MDTPVITEMDMVIRLCLGFVAGAIIGFERSSRRQVAGLRTHILIATGATLLMILSIWLPQEFNSLKNGDPGRIAAQVVSGIGFLGAGAIIRLGNNVKGLTTAASLWLIAAVGLAIGAGMFLAAAVTEIITLVTLILLDVFEKKLFPSERNKILELTYKSSIPDTKEAMKILKSFGVRIQSVDVNQSIGKDKGARLRLLVGMPDSTDISKLAKAMKTTGNVERFEMKEKY
ncbi:MgtC/SapB family protein [Breznakiella homolactica]|uniref:MgtC/SapB family protein n=1 Tax=Breznakiella homolactica TaxID=2798577 RepID=A0A7T8BAY2_9SPIR|nr:MgtC/SapB family protein [Breznakiella homolactica]QQO08643.1 MgtC/SapB family protein [Breznakiella homolactica]